MGPPTQQTEPADFIDPGIVGLRAASEMRRGSPLGPEARMKGIPGEAIAVTNRSARARFSCHSRHHAGDDRGVVRHRIGRAPGFPDAPGDGLDGVRTCRLAPPGPVTVWLYRSALGGLSDEIPGASEKVEGAVEGRAAVPGQSGVVILHRDRFFDGMVFDPSP